MTLVGPLRQLNPQAVQALTELAARTGRVPGVGHTPLGTPRWQEVNAVPSGRFSGHDASIAAWSENRDGRIDVFAQAWRGASDPTWVAEILVDPTMSSMTADVGAPLLSRLLQGIGTASTDQGAQRLELWVTNASAGHAELAARAGLAAYRTLHQMLRPLPIERTRKLTVRAFNVAADVEEVLEVNRRSFVAHPSQGDLTLEQFQQQMSEPWFDPNGFLIAEADTRIAGFCWTKLFDPDPTNARQGEIHVICVDPDFVGHGFGQGLVEEGLSYLFAHGATEGMLFVEGDNAAALSLYHRMGFETIRTDRAYAATVAAGATQ